MIPDQNYGKFLSYFIYRAPPFTLPFSFPPERPGKYRFYCMIMSLNYIMYLNYMCIVEKTQYNFSYTEEGQSAAGVSLTFV
jgi:hypothetical protein